jgi:RNA polymerase sigma factor
VELLILALFKRFLGKSRYHPSDDSPAGGVEQTVLRIQQGDMELRNQLITDFQPYIMKLTSRFCKRYIDPAKDDEFSIALSAFNEAINQFSSSAGKSFLGFAETVVRRRLIDHVRKEQRHSRQVPYSSFDMQDEEENVHNPVETSQALEDYDRQRGSEERRAEISDLSRCLMDFDIGFADLVNAAPKHTDTRQTLFGLGRTLAEDPQLMRLLLVKKLLPIKELLERVQLSRKTLERNRKYIIAVALIWNGPYPYMQEYLRDAAPRAEKSDEHE